MKEITVVKVLIGIPGSGKSTYAKSRHKYITHSSDELRKEMFGTYEEFTRNGELFEQLHKNILTDLQQGKDVIFDATNLGYKKRKGFLDKCPKGCIKIAVVFATDIDICIANDMLRERRVGSEVIMKMVKNFNFPLKQEGFDGIEVIQHKDNSMTSRKLLSLTKDFNQDNPHHTLTLDKHMEKVYEEYVNDKTTRTKPIIGTALSLHDIGKVFCKTYKSYDGKKDLPHAAYYGHENVSAYLIACIGKEFRESCLGEEQFHYLIALVNYHMLGHKISSVKTRNRYRDFLGEDMYRDLMIINKYDTRGK